MVHYEVVDKQGTRTRYTDITGLLAILTSDTNELIAQGIHVITIIDSESGSNNIDNWYFKPISESWYPESESKLVELSSEYHQMVLGNVPEHVWVLRHYKSETIQELSYKLHITKDIDINEYREQLETISIVKVITHKDLATLLCVSLSTSPL